MRRAHRLHPHSGTVQSSSTAEVQFRVRALLSDVPASRGLMAKRRLSTRARGATRFPIQSCTLSPSSHRPCLDECRTAAPQSAFHAPRFAERRTGPGQVSRSHLLSAPDKTLLRWRDALLLLDALLDSLGLNGSASSVARQLPGRCQTSVSRSARHAPCSLARCRARSACRAAGTVTSQSAITDEAVLACVGALLAPPCQ